MINRLFYSVYFKEPMDGVTGDFVVLLWFRLWVWTEEFLNGYGV